MLKNDKWSALSMKDKASLIKMMVENGVTSLDDMKLYYNGGNKKEEESNKKQNRLNKIAEFYHKNAGKLPKWFHRTVYNTIKDSSFGNDPLSELKYNFVPNLLHNKAGSVDNTFLMSTEQQKEALAKEGLYPVDTTGNYGLVNAAVQKYKTATGRDVPIYQYGKDDANREDLIPLNNIDLYRPGSNSITVVDEKDPKTGMITASHIEELGTRIGDTAATPTRYYRDKDNNIYYKSWDFFDHGDYSRSEFKEGDRGYYVTPGLTNNSRLYGNILDKAGNPFVRTTGYVKINDESIGEALQNITGDFLLKEDYAKILSDIYEGKYDIKKYGGSIHIKPENRGKFTALKERTGHSTSWFREHGTPAQKKMAVFAANAKKWHHADGGPLGDKDTLSHPKYNAASEAAMYNYLSNSGLNSAQAAGIMGNLAVESLLNSNINQFNGPAYGLIQAEGARKKALKSYQGNPYVFGSGLLPEEQKQLDYIINIGINNYTPGEWGRQGYNGARAARKAFIDSSDVNEASDIFMRNYLRPGKPHQDRRRKMSNYYFNKYGQDNFIFDDSKWSLQNILTK